MGKHRAYKKDFKDYPRGRKATESYPTYAPVYYQTAAYTTKRELHFIVLLIEAITDNFNIIFISVLVLMTI